MPKPRPWGFYGRSVEQDMLQSILDRRRWFFAKISGRRRIGKTTLIHRALQATGREQVFYVQVPDSGPSGVLSAVADAMDTFRLGDTRPRPTSLQQLSALIAQLVREGIVVVLDEFQYFHRKHLHEFCSFLQREVDALSATAHEVPGGLIVLGSIHTEMMAILDDRAAPLFNRVTDELDIGHLDIASVVELLEAHGEVDGPRLLFLWNLFEGVPKFYRDCYEQGVLSASRRDILQRMFFLSSSPLRSEADNWFLKELHGRYDALLKGVARKPGSGNAELLDYIRTHSSDTKEQVGGYLRILIEKYRMIERRLPVFASPRARRGRYYLCDNFLRTWLAALAPSVAAVNFAPVSRLVQDADSRLENTEGHGLERLVAKLYEERSRKEVGDFPVTERATGYWNSKDTEIDLVALDATTHRVRLGHLRRNPQKLLSGAPGFDAHVARFLVAQPHLAGWTVEKLAVAPQVTADDRCVLTEAGFLVQDLEDLILGLR